MNTIVKITVFVGITLTLMGCGPQIAIQMYSGERKELGEIATLHRAPTKFVETFYIESIDDKKFPVEEPNRINYIDILPGTHTIDYVASFFYLKPGIGGRTEKTTFLMSSSIQFKAEAGHNYSIRTYLNPDTHKINSMGIIPYNEPVPLKDFLTVIIDKTTDTIVAKVIEGTRMEDGGENAFWEDVQTDHDWQLRYSSDKGDKEFSSPLQRE